MPQPVIHILQEYFSGFVMRFYTKTYTTRWVLLEVGIAMGCTISPSILLAMQILLKAAGSNIPEAHIGKGVNMPPIKAFKDDTTLIMNKKKVVQKYPGQIERPARVVSNGFQVCEIQKSRPGQRENSQRPHFRYGGTAILACRLAEWVAFLHAVVVATVVMCRVRNPVCTARERPGVGALYKW